MANDMERIVIDYYDGLSRRFMLCDSSSFDNSTNDTNQGYPDLHSGAKTDSDSEGDSDTFILSAYDNRDDSSDSYDYSLQIESIIENQALINENIVTLNENIKFCSGLVFSIVFFVMIKIAFSIFNRLLGLDKV